MTVVTCCGKCYHQRYWEPEKKENNSMQERGFHEDGAFELGLQHRSVQGRQEGRRVSRQRRGYGVMASLTECGQKAGP